ncbi:hypothetical protein Acsp06_57680 [Actinomycetospora sp. NBRC 106375]|uniref:DUF1684 domain-containing protein n=1 Tax=Actinomycetospora sp. NBRC 106375 TaxID=3032207 RepID=UPI0024A11C47|nr:DUF1684 domain-containing protein [Actinomycetospora sp. NBRC 106375]GLZ49583.1 hypothetical protein Acsp06_57680 [Actinomycetospora sp. NBRC 106375]
MTSTLDLAQDWATWHAEREDVLRAPHGWLSLTGLYWLDGEARPYPGLPGTWRAADGGVEITAAAADEVGVDGEPVDGTARVEPVDGKPGVLVTVDRRRVEVIRREEHLALRVRDPEARTRREFAGVPAFPVDAAWVVTGRFTPWDAPRRIDVDTVVDGLGFHPTAVGTVTFTVGGAEQELVALSGEGDELKLHFRDGTSGAETYGGGRILRTEVPAADGSVRIDFNRTLNLPCAFTASATCPLPPAGNTVTVPVAAGEKTPV